jgi:glycosyltransferase involved in cell wall biosynthesis
VTRGAPLDQEQYFLQAFPESMQAQVDVLVPVYNGAATVRDAIESLRAQTMPHLRIIVVDDGSTDNTAAILASLARRDPRIHVVKQANAGGVHARNVALRLCSAEFVACLDADDIAFPDRLERQIAYMRHHPECVAMGGAVEHIDESGGPRPGLPQPGPPSAADARKVPVLEPYIVHSTLMARRADVEAVGGYRHVPYSEDSDLFWRLSERGKLVNLPNLFSKYRLHDASASGSLINGRVMAIGTQLGALSYLRRRAGRHDLTFTSELLGDLKAAVTLDKMVTCASKQLDQKEADHLRLGAGVTLMEFARYRDYELDVGDCALIRAALPCAQQSAIEKRKEVAWYVTETAARLLRKGRLAEAFALTPPKHYPIAIARLLLQYKSRASLNTQLMPCAGIYDQVHAALFACPCLLP